VANVLPNRCTRSEDEHQEPDHHEQADQKDDADDAAEELENSCHAIPITSSAASSACRSSLFLGLVDALLQHGAAGGASRAANDRADRSADQSARGRAPDTTARCALLDLSPQAATNSGANAAPPRTPICDRLMLTSR
jgi:hypothetical protein